jgi:hypothetical protein
MFWSSITFTSNLKIILSYKIYYSIEYNEFCREVEKYRKIDALNTKVSAFLKKFQ